MLASKVIFNLVYLGQTSPSIGSYYFRVLHVDQRFTGRERFRAANGWRIGIADYPEVSFEGKTLYFGRPGINAERNQRPFVARITAPNETLALENLQSLVDAIKDWALHCPEVVSPAPIGSDVKSPEVRESLLMLEDDEVADGEAPIYVDEFAPPNIALS